jgi:allantoin racemase
MNREQRIAILGTGDAATAHDQVPRPLLDAASAGFSPQLVDVPGAVFPDTPAARAACADAYLKAGLDAERDGYAGLYINTFGDYGLDALQSRARVPVTGSGAGAIRQAAGQDFAIVTIWPAALRFIYDHVLEQNAAADRCRGIHHLSDDDDLATLGQPDNFVAKMQGCRLTTMKRIQSACHSALTDGAEVILLGCTCMQPVAATLKASGLPVIEPMTAGYRYLETCLT